MTKRPSSEGPREGPHLDSRRAEGAILADNVSAIAEIERGTLHQRSAADRLSDAITRGVGSTPSVLVHLCWFGLWIAINTGVIPGIAPFDPFPFSFLTLTVSLEAIFLTVFVLMSQNRMAHESDQRAHLDLQVDLLAERELTAILQLVQALCEKLDVNVNHCDERIEDLAQKTDVRRVAAAIEEKLPKK